MWVEVDVSVVLYMYVPINVLLLWWYGSGVDA